MARTCVFFAFVLMVSAFSLVTARYQSRQLFVQVEALNSRAHDLDTDWRRLQLERAELARHARIDDVARSELGMHSSSPARTLYLPAPTGVGKRGQP
jgi:cell division protein FtsL